MRQTLFCYTRQQIQTEIALRGIILPIKSKMQFCVAMRRVASPGLAYRAAIRFKGRDIGRHVPLQRSVRDS